MEGSNYWGYGYKIQLSYPRSRLITWRRPELKFGRNVVKKKQHKNYYDEDKKSAIYKKLIPKLVIDRGRDGIHQYINSQDMLRKLHPYAQLRLQNKGMKLSALANLYCQN